MNDFQTSGPNAAPRAATGALVAALLIGAAPAINGLFTWQPNYASWPLRPFTVPVSVPVLAMEHALPLIAIVACPKLRSTLQMLNKPVVISLACLMILAAFNAGFVAVAPASAVFMTYVNVVHALAALALACLLRDVPGFGLMVVKSMAIGLILYQAICYFLLFTHPDLSQLDLSYVGIGVTNVRHLGYVGAIGTALGLGLAVYSRGHRQHLAWLATAAISLGFILWSGSRGGVYAVLGLAAASFLFLSGRQRILAFWRGLAAISLPAVLLAQIWVPPNENWGLDRILDRMQIIGDEGIKTFTSSRTELWIDAIQLIGHRPWTGYGQVQFKFLAPAALQYYPQPHNFILQYLVDWGVIGFCLAGFVMLTGFWQGRKASLAGDPARTAAMMGAVTLAAFGLIDGTLYHIYPLSAFVMLLTIAGFGHYTSPNVPPAQPGSPPAR